MKRSTLFLFRNVHETMKADRLCRSLGILARAIPVPEDVSSECGMCLQVSTEEQNRCERAFRENDLTFSIENYDEP